MIPSKESYKLDKRTVIMSVTIIRYQFNFYFFTFKLKSQRSITMEAEVRNKTHIKNTKTRQIT
jgi:hypothetical protein